MARKKQPKPALDYHEPWSAVQSKLAIPEIAECPPGADPEQIARARETRERVIEAAPWNVWGTGMVPAARAKGFASGQEVSVDTKGIIVTVHKMTGDGPTQEQFAQRIAACVTAFKGIRDPEETLALIRGLLSDLFWGKADTSDERLSQIQQLLGLENHS